MSPRTDRPYARRGFLGVIGTGAAVGLTGCLGGGNGAGSDGGDADEGDEHPHAPVLSEPGDDPIEFTDDQHCVVCNMTPTDYSNWQSQLAHETGERAVFCTPGCLSAYYAVPAVDSEIVGVWTTDFESGDLIDATEAFFVLVTDGSAVPDEPMNPNPRPFEDRDDAVAYLDEWEAEDLTEDDIVELEAIDREVAAIYRGNRLPDE